MNEEYVRETEAQDVAEPLTEDALPRRNRSRREPVVNDVGQLDYDDAAYEAESNRSLVREVLESSNAWNAMMADEKIGQYVRYTEDGVEAVASTPPRIRGLLYSAATAILHANDVRYEAQHELPFYARLLID